MILLNEPWRDQERRRRKERTYAILAGLCTIGAWILIGIAIGYVVCHN